MQIGLGAKKADQNGVDAKRSMAAPDDARDQFGLPDLLQRLQGGTRIQRPGRTDRRATWFGKWRRPVAEEALAALAAKVRSFTKGVAAGAAGSTVRTAPVRRPSFWKDGSKSVSFLTMLDIREDIEYAVEINPRRSGTFIAGTGQQIVAPDFLAQYRPTW